MTNTRAAAILVAIGCSSGRWLGGKHSYWLDALFEMTENAAAARDTSYLQFIIMNKAFFDDKFFINAYSFVGCEASVAGMFQV